MPDRKGRDTADADLIALAPAPFGGRRDRAWAAALVALPVVIFVVPALLGHPSIDADNLIQNFPLRVLAGRQLWGGHLPLLNPLTDSGTPLLGAMNAGALFPLTLLFAVLPPLVAWTINMIAVYAAGAIGVYALARGLRLAPLASGVAALVYAYGGAMIGQAVHLGVIQGYALLPWLLVAVVGLARRLAGLEPSAPARELAWTGAPYALAVAGVWGLVFLTGEPRAIADAELVSLVAGVGVLVLASSYRPRGARARVAYLATLAAGFAGGVGIGLVQVLPGWSFISVSQRHAISYAFFGAGSLPVRWTLLLFNPVLLGGNGAFHQAGFFANYNLPEVTGYVGVVALCALFAFATRLTRRGWVGSERDLTLYVTLLVVGLFATWGNFTPAGHLFRALPLFGSTRLQSRNVALADLALAVLLAWWLDRLAAGEGRRAGLGRVARWVTALPALGVAAVSVGELVDGPALVRWVGITSGGASLATGLRGADVVFATLGLASAALVVAGARWRHLRRALVALCLLDLVAFSAFTSTGLVGGAGPREASRAYASSVLGVRGRFALVDYQGTHTESYRALGQPNMNVFTRLASVQGYGSLLATDYDTATGTHPQNWVDPCALARGVFAPLRLSTIVVATQLLAQPGTADSPRPSSCLGFHRAPTVTRAFGEVLDVAALTLRAPAGHTLATGELSVRFLSVAGRPLPGTWRASGTGARDAARARAGRGRRARGERPGGRRRRGPRGHDPRGAPGGLPARQPLRLRPVGLDVAPRGDPRRLRRLARDRPRPAGVGGERRGPGDPRRDGALGRLVGERAGHRTPGAGALDGLPAGVAGERAQRRDRGDARAAGLSPRARRRRRGAAGSLGRALPLPRALHRDRERGQPRDDRGVGRRARRVAGPSTPSR